jgi:hypothetical protein
MNRFWKVVWLSALMPVAFAILDVIGSKMWASLGGFAAEAYVTAEPLYMRQFWGFAYLIIAVIALTYYLVRKDKSEALALILVPYILLQFGVEDVLYYIFKGLSLSGQTMPWLWNHLIPPTVMARLFGLEMITGGILVVSALIGLWIAHRTARILEAQKW